MTAFHSIDESEIDQEKLRELASIARLITYARQSAKSVDAEFPVWCLDMALAAVLQEINATSKEDAPFVDFDEDASTPMQRH